MSDDWAAAIAELNSISIGLELSGARAGARAAIAIRKTTFDIEADSKAFSAVDTSAQRNSIGHDITGDGRSGAIESVIGPTTSYSPYNEFGTSTQAPQAFMGPAFDRHAHQLEDALGQIAADTLGS